MLGDGGVLRKKNVFGCRIKFPREMKKNMNFEQINFRFLCVWRKCDEGAQSRVNSFFTTVKCTCLHYVLIFWNFVKCGFRFVEEKAHLFCFKQTFFNFKSEILFPILEDPWRLLKGELQKNFKTEEFWIFWNSSLYQ